MRCKLVSTGQTARVDARRAGGEPRWSARGPIRDRLLVMVFNLRVNAVRITRLRRANRREVRRYAET